MGAGARPRGPRRGGPGAPPSPRRRGPNRPPGGPSLPAELQTTGRFFRSSLGSWQSGKGLLPATLLPLPSPCSRTPTRGSPALGTQQPPKQPASQCAHAGLSAYSPTRSPTSRCPRQKAGLTWHSYLSGMIAAGAPNLLFNWATPHPSPHRDSSGVCSGSPFSPITSLTPFIRISMRSLYQQGAGL